MTTAYNNKQKSSTNEGVKICANRLCIGLLDNTTRTSSPQVFCIVIFDNFPYQNLLFLWHPPVGGFEGLIMMAIGFPYPSYVWSRGDGKPMRNPTQTDLPEISILNITNIQTSDFGNYSLTMNNSFGSYVAHYQLIQSGKTNSLLLMLYIFQ
jgi:hypothetical protein